MVPPVRSKIKRTSKDQKNKHDEQSKGPVRISGYDYTSWDKYDVVSFTLFIAFISHIHFLASEAGYTGYIVMQSYEDVWGSRGIAPHIHNLSVWW